MLYRLEIFNLRTGEWRYTDWHESKEVMQSQKMALEGMHPNLVCVIQSKTEINSENIQ